MAVLGVNGSTNGLWLAVVDEDGKVLKALTSITPADNTPLAEQITDTVATAERLFSAHEVSSVAILDAEPSGKSSYSQLVPRISLEAAIMMAARNHGIPVERRSRASVRAAFGLSRSGKLYEHAANIVGPHPPHWKNRRDLAALVAMAELSK